MLTPKAATARPSKYTKLVNGLKSYLTKARADPSLPLTILAISRAIGVMKSTIYLYQHDPQIAEQLSIIRTLSTARKRACNTDELCDVEAGDVDISNPIAIADLEDVDTPSINLEVLAVRSAGAVQKAVWSVSRFIGHHRKHRHVSDLPRVVYDLDITLAELHRVREELSSLSNEWMQISKDNDEIVTTEDQLSLSYISKEQF